MAIPVTLVDARRQLRMEIDDTSRDVELGQFIADAAGWVEKYTGHVLVARDVEEQFASFDRLQLRAWPVKPDSAIAVEFQDRAGAAIAIAGARVVVRRRPAFAMPAFGTGWPAVGAGVVTVTVHAGYEPTDVVPGNFRRAMLVLITAYDVDREGGEVFATAERTARLLCTDFRARAL